jgi:hypothetical protein
MSWYKPISIASGPKQAKGVLNYDSWSLSSCSIGQIIAFSAFSIHHKIANLVKVQIFSWLEQNQNGRHFTFARISSTKVANFFSDTGFCTKPSLGDTICGACTAILMRLEQNQETNDPKYAMLEILKGITR